MKVEGLMIATCDGGMADLFMKALQRGIVGTYLPPYLEVTGQNKQEQSQSLYEKMEEGIAIFRNQEEKWKVLKRQWASFLSIASGSRMMRDYLQFVFEPFKS